ncbi:MAG TPA: hypothetical protein VMF11_07875 [Candidatus Baltobacteraceae bacterium]|nr:hypothetical protein [Candidatus Baltobacteraceae bacterium]
MQPTTATIIPSRRALEFGIYRDGDNNLDASQSLTVAQALQSSRTDSAVEFTVEDTTGLRVDDGDLVEGRKRTDSFTIADGQISDPQIGKARNMASESNLAQFVAQTLERAEKSGAKQTWIDLVDHGGGDGGGLETHTGAVMSMPDMAQAIADGVALHAKEHPEDAGRTVDGVVANQCLMDTMGFADALSRVGVKYLAASPETMLSPGVPTGVADAIARNAGDPDAMARSVVNTAMRVRYPGPDGEWFGTAAAFDVLDLSPTKIANAERAIKTFNDAVAADAADRPTIRRDVASVSGMVRFSGATPDMPWHADRPAIALYDTIASDAALPSSLRSDARAAANATRALVMAHQESRGFGPFDGSSYADAVGPTIHAPTARKQIDPWASHGISETKNAFYDAVDQAKFVGAIA